MRNRSVVTIAVGIAVLLTSATANGQDHEAAAMAAVPDGMFPLPVLAARAEVRRGDLLPVCLYHGARPRELMVVSQMCRRGEEHCTVMVAVPRTDPFAFLEFNAANPPVITTADGRCDRPYSAPVAGTLQTSR